MTHAPRPPPEHCHYEPNYGPDSFPRQSDTGWLPPDDTMNVDSKCPLPLPTTCVGGSTDDHRGQEPMSPLTVMFTPLLLMTEIFLLPTYHQPIHPIQFDYLSLMTMLQGCPLLSMIQMFDLQYSPICRYSLWPSAISRSLKCSTSSPF